MHEAPTGTPAEAEFGTAEEYASQFPKKKGRTRGKIVVSTGLVLALFYPLITFLLKPLAGGVLFGFSVDYFQPAQSPCAAR